MTMPQFNPRRGFLQKGEFIRPPIDPGRKPLLSIEEFQFVSSRLDLPITAVRVNLPWCFHLEDRLYPFPGKRGEAWCKLYKMDRSEIPYHGGQTHGLELLVDPNGLFRFTQLEVYFAAKYVDGSEAEANPTPRSLLTIYEQLDSHTKFTLYDETGNTIEGVENNEWLRSDDDLWRVARAYYKQLSPDKRREEYLRLRRLLLLEDTVNGVNRMLEHYVELTGEFWLRPLFWSDLFNMIYFEIQSNERVTLSVVQEPPFPVTLAHPDRSVEIHQALWERWRDGKQVALHERLVTKAWRSFFEQDFRIATTEAYSAAEVAIVRFLTQLLKRSGKNDEEIDQLLNHQWRSTDDKLKDGLRALTGKSISEDTDLWNKWVHRVKAVRDRVVHHGHSPSQSETLELLWVVGNVLEAITQ